MAEKVKLRDYQKSILDRLDVVNAGDAGDASRYLGVIIGDRHVLVDLQEITETLVVTEIQPVPLVKPWFLGMTNVRGVLYAINDLAQLIDGVTTELSSDTRMLLFSDDVISNVGFLADKLVGLRNTDLMKRVKSKKKDNLYFGDDCYEDDDKNVWHVFNAQRLASASEFEVPYAV